jgi:hypothetical protein
MKPPTAPSCFASALPIGVFDTAENRETRISIDFACVENAIICTQHRSGVKMAVSKRIGELQDELKAKDRRIEELRQEIDEERDLVRRLREHAEDYNNNIEAWCEAFGMEMTEDGSWTWKPFWKEHNELIDNYNDLVRNWNKYLPRIRGEPRNVGRPLGASEAQVAEVLRLHKRRRSLRGIVDDTSLGFQTVRTIIATRAGTDRTTKKHRQRLERIEIDRQQLARWKRQRRTGNALPRQAKRVIEEGRALIKEAKGLGGK